MVRLIGGFDEAHFAYLEDMDLCWRARIHGWKSWYEPDAEVFHVGSATSGSRYNRFKVLHSAGNNLYMIYKNMPLAQMLLNLPFLLVGFLIKYLFFVKRDLEKITGRGLQEVLSCAGSTRTGKFVFYGRICPLMWQFKLNFGKIYFFFCRAEGENEGKRMRTLD